MTSRWALIVFAAAAVLVSADCKPRMGETCGETAVACADEHTMLVCKAGRFSNIACEGEGGCVYDDKTRRASCDFSEARTGGFCDSTFLGERMCRSDTKMIVCGDHKFESFPCRGPQGCSPSPDERVRNKTPFARVDKCDESVGSVGDDCDPRSTVDGVCDVEGHEELHCNQRSRRLTFRRQCRGPAGCKSKDGKAVCDDSVRQLGDACRSETERWDKCTDDGRQLLSCEHGSVWRRVCEGGCSIGPLGPLCNQKP